jgi:hypothetical protein
MSELNGNQITSADEFARLRTSNDLIEQARAGNEAVADGVWHEVIIHYPELKKWVAHNKMVPLEILRLLAKDDDWQVRSLVARKRKLDRALFEQLSLDQNEVVRRCLETNAKCPQEIRLKLEAARHD